MTFTLRTARLIGILIGLGACGLAVHSADAATLYISPSSASIVEGQSVTVTVKVNSAGQAINASEGTLSFPNALLELKSVSRSGSIFSFWAVQPNGSTGSGKITYSGGLPTPGYSGSGGTIYRATFTAKKNGKATLSLSGGKVLANDGQGTNVITAQGSAVVTIAEASSTPSAPVTPSVPTRPNPSVSSSTHPDQSGWYDDETATVAWVRPSGIEGVSYGLTSAPDSVPDDTLEPNTGTASIPLPGDGVWYFHIRARYASGWSNTVHYALRRDRTAPESFNVTVSRDRGAADPSPALVFSTTDVLSGVVKYTVALDGEPEKEALSPYVLTITKAGEHTAVVVAYDRAGNTRTAEVTFSVEGYTPPIISEVSSPIVLLDPLIVKGTAVAGDIITIFVNDRQLGQTIAGIPSSEADAAGITVRAPWIFTSDDILRPGTYQVTAVAKSVDGQISVASDPVVLHVSGQLVQFGGRTIATVAFAPLVAVAIILILLVNAGVLIRLWLTLRRMVYREMVVERDLETLRREFLHHHVTPEEAESMLYTIEQELEGRRPVARVTTTRRKSKRK